MHLLGEALVELRVVLLGDVGGVTRPEGLEGTRGERGELHGRVIRRDSMAVDGVRGVREGRAAWANQEARSWAILAYTGPRGVGYIGV